MVSVDFRTRTDADVSPVDAATFFGDELPKLIGDRSDLAVPGTRELSPRPLAIRVGDQSWTMALAGDAITISDSFRDREIAAPLKRARKDVRSCAGRSDGDNVDARAGEGRECGHRHAL